jgi:hypothetical protein
MAELAQRFGDGEHFVGASADADVFREIAPTHSAAAIDQEFSGAGDIGASRTAASVQQMILPDHLGLCVGEDWECVAGFGGQIARDVRRVHADGDGADARSLEFGKLFFDAS